MSEKTIAIYDTPAEAVAALRELHREGVPRSSIRVMSSEPLHLEDSGAGRSRIPAFAIAGGFVGAAFAILLTVLTSRKVDLITGGMPVVTPWAFGIIVFELAALGAILSTLGRMILEARLARGVAPEEYDTAVSEGKVVLCVD